MFHADGQTYMTTLIVAAADFAKAPIKKKYARKWTQCGNLQVKEKERNEGNKGKATYLNKLIMITAIK
jgi:hypothetical protein